MSGFERTEPAPLVVERAGEHFRARANGRELVVNALALRAIEDLGVEGPSDWREEPSPIAGQRQLARDFLLFYFFGQGRLSKSVNYAELVLPTHSRKIAVIPPTVSLLLSNACNMKCVHCYNDSGRVAQNELTSEERMRLADYVARWGVRLVAITGGEPLIHRDAIPLMRHLAAHRIKMRVSTNAWVVQDAVLDLVREGAIYKMNVSLDGATEQSHDRYRLKDGSFQRVLSALTALRAAGLPQLNLSVAVYDDNLRELADICELAGRHGATSVSFKPVTMSGRSEKRASNGRLPMASVGWSLSTEGLARYRRLREELRARYQTETLKIEGAINSAEVPEEENDAMNCHGAEEALFIASNGDLTPCELVTEYLEVPNVRTTAPASAWLSSQAFASFRAMNQQQREKSENHLSGCPAMNFARKKAEGATAGSFGATGTGAPGARH